MVRYPFDPLRAVSKVEPLTTNGKSNGHRTLSPFALRYRRVNGDQISVIGTLPAPSSTEDKFYRLSDPATILLCYFLGRPLYHDTAQILCA